MRGPRLRLMMDQEPPRVEQWDRLRAWLKAEHIQRTRLICEGKGRIDWLDYGTRVSFSEVCAKAAELGLDVSPVQIRQQTKGVIKS